MELMREQVTPFSGRLARGWPYQLTVSLSRNLLNTFLPKSGMLPNSAGVDKLRRARPRIPPSFPLAFSHFQSPYYFHYKSLHLSGHHQLAKTFIGILEFLHRSILSNDHIPVCDDFIRQFMKSLHDYSFPRVVREGPAWMFLCHLHALGGKRPWEKEAVDERIKEWVDSPTLLKDTTSHRAKLDEIFAIWVPKTAGTTPLSFFDYCQDPIRWGTSGGAPATEIDGSKYRTKWAWAWSRLLGPNGFNDNVNLYYAAMARTPNLAKVALKEESTKTREIITTPMASYLRQSYLAYLWGRPPLDSPIGRRAWLRTFQSQRFRWYAAIDGKNFDHHVPFWFISLILSKLGTVSPEAASVAAAEVKHLSNLTIETPSGLHIKYRNGVLSGWRLTSLIDTLATEVVVRTMLDRTLSRGAFSTGTMGDDLIIASRDVDLPPTWLVDQYDSAGMVTNASKTTSGPVGEFLRKVYAPQGVLGYPALALKSIFFASPWISSFDPNNPKEVSTSWLTWLSRLLPLCLPNNQDLLSAWIKKQCFHDLLRWGIDASKEHLWAALSTPISAGGLGCTEWVTSVDWVAIHNVSTDRQTSFLSKFGIGKQAKTFKSDFTPRVLLPHTLSLLASKFTRSPGIADVPHLPYNINLSRALATWYFNDSIPAVQISKTLNIKLPRGLRVSGKSAIFDFILGLTKSAGMLTSIQVTPETNEQLTRDYKALSVAYLQTHKSSGVRNISAALTWLQMTTRASTLATRGTW